MTNRITHLSEQGILKLIEEYQEQNLVLQILDLFSISKLGEPNYPKYRATLSDGSYKIKISLVEAAANLVNQGKTNIKEETLLSKAVILTTSIQRVVADGRKPQIYIREFKVIYPCVFETIGEPLNFNWDEEMNYGEMTNENRRIRNQNLLEEIKPISSSTLVTKPQASGMGFNTLVKVMKVLKSNRRDERIQ